jgi:hypothetical protein
MHVDDEALTYTHTSTLKTLVLSKLADRFFCTGCGAPIAMKYHDQDVTGLVLGSLDLDTFKGTVPKVEQHIFLREKAPWVILPDDDAKRLETFSSESNWGSS